MNARITEKGFYLIVICAIDCKNSKWIISVTLIVGIATSVSGQTTSPTVAPKKTEPLISGSLRVREEFWDWFNPTSGDFDNQYHFTGAILRVAAARRFRWGEAKAEVAAPTLWGLPKNAAAPAPQGLLGLGGVYRTVNGGQNGSVFIKQAYLGKGFEGGQNLRAGRFEFSEGAETVPGNPALAWVKRERVAQRLVGPFAWALVGRSLDGISYTLNLPTFNLTGLAAYPTQGVFDLDGAATLTAVRVGYLGATFPDYRNKSSYGEWRGFLLAYTDTRDVARTDNSTVKDRDDINLWTVGGHVLRGGATAGGSWDALGWAAYQFGDWGKKSQSSFAFAAEGGYLFGKRDNAPWLRAGYYYASGDSDPSDGDHNTFYAPLSTPRIYARTPFYTESNIKDLFIQALWKPDPRVSLRADYHRLDLASSGDLWYSADGPFQTRPLFGMFGRPAGGKTALGDLTDLSVDFAATSRDTVTLYYGLMSGRSVIKNIYPNGARGSFAYLEYLRKF